MKINIKTLRERQNFLLSQLEPNCALVFFSGIAKIRNFDCDYSFRVDSDFYYLTGIEEANALLYLFCTPQGEHKKFLVIFNPTSLQRQWSSEHKLQISTLSSDYFDLYDAVFSWQEKEKTQQALNFSPKHIYCLTPRDKNLPEEFFPDLKLHTSLREQLSLKRALKDQDELKLMKIAQSHTSQSFKKIMSHPYGYFKSEKHIASHWYSYGIEHGLEQAYGPIIASGSDACTLHYQDNNKDFHLDNPDVVLMDAGYEYEYYASDITRMIFLQKPSTAFQELYEIVLKTQEKMIEHVCPGKTLSEIQGLTKEYLLKELKLLGALPEKATLHDLKDAYMHGIGHHLGLDVHDAQRLNQKTLLKPSMVLTIEPGLYFNHQRFENTPWYNIGIRLEDNILVTSQGFENLSDIPKKLSDLLHV